MALPAGVSNGMIPRTFLARLPWGEADHLYLRPGAAHWLGLLAAEFAREFGRPLYLSDAYRTFDAQVRLKAQKGAFAARPGTSNHGWGKAVDVASRVNVDSSAEHRWFEKVAPRFGWVNPRWATDRDPSNGQYEPWHWEFQWDPDAMPPPEKPEPARTPVPVTEDDMKDIIAALYLKNLGRLPDPAGAAGWIAAVATGATTWADVDRALQTTGESQAFAALGSEDARNARRNASGWTF